MCSNDPVVIFRENSFIKHIAWLHRLKWFLIITAKINMYMLLEIIYKSCTVKCVCYIKTKGCPSLATHLEHRLSLLIAIWRPVMSLLHAICNHTGGDNKQSGLCITLEMHCTKTCHIQNTTGTDQHMHHTSSLTITVTEPLQYNGTRSKMNVHEHTWKPLHFYIQKRKRLIAEWEAERNNSIMYPIWRSYTKESEQSGGGYHTIPNILKSTHLQPVHN
jgi:hypothetical protein